MGTTFKPILFPYGSLLHLFGGTRQPVWVYGMNMNDIAMIYSSYATALGTWIFHIMYVFFCKQDVSVYN